MGDDSKHGHAGLGALARGAKVVPSAVMGLSHFQAPGPHSSVP